ncbi:hypothetical protein B9Z19DRAFT_1076628 [Tuber borchii]|uniref:Cryptic loci regulator 2 N-terminal domain-containing protein n=1 Tax=Tuber borchii TaxID=42251 RepID=A0A2T7A1N5_TUBBO|nr:hypothetical protein B9Z19DRAFT_1076628 [Tuber borchii]
MPTPKQPQNSPDFLLYTVYVPPIEPTPVLKMPPTKEDLLLVALTWSDGVRKFNPPSMDRDPCSDADFYKPIRRSDDKALDWLSQLGVWPNGLKDSLFRRKVGEGKCIVFELPDGYSLYEKVHIPTKVPHPLISLLPLTLPCFLFGHPSGEPFKSPGDFRRHYLWMACDPLKDPKNCKCRLCLKDRVKGKYAVPVREPATVSTVSTNPQSSVGSWGSVSSWD